MIEFLVKANDWDKHVNENREKIGRRIFTDAVIYDDSIHGEYPNIIEVANGGNVYVDWPTVERIAREPSDVSLAVRSICRMMIAARDGKTEKLK